MKNTSYFFVVDLDNNWYKTEACQSPDRRQTGSGHFRKLRPFTQVTPVSY